MFHGVVKQCLFFLYIFVSIVAGIRVHQLNSIDFLSFLKYVFYNLLFILYCFCPCRCLATGFVSYLVQFHLMI